MMIQRSWIVVGALFTGLSSLTAAHAAAPEVTGLRANIYSVTSSELFWDRVPNRALRYEVFRDDGLTNVTSGNSYYDNRRFPDQRNTYFVTTIDEEGNRSNPVSIEVSSGS